MTALAPTADVAPTSEARGVVAAPGRIAAWMTIARAGDEFVYATRLRMTTLPAKSAGAAAMRDLAQSGQVILFQRGAGDSEGLWRNYVARRTTAPIIAAAPKAGPKVAPDPVAVSANAENVVLGVLTRRAALGRPCPTLREIAQLTGLDSAVCDRAMAALVDGNVIHILSVPAPTRRIVTIVATGRQTGSAQ